MALALLLYLIDRWPYAQMSRTFPPIDSATQITMQTVGGWCDKLDFSYSTRVVNNEAEVYTGCQSEIIYMYMHSYYKFLGYCD